MTNNAVPEIRMFPNVYINSLKLIECFRKPFYLGSTEVEQAQFNMRGVILGDGMMDDCLVQLKILNILDLEKIIYELESIRNTWKLLIEQKGQKHE